MPVSGELKVTQHNRFRHFRHEDEIAQPHYYKVTLDNRITAEMSPTERGVFMRFTYPEGKDAYVVLDLNKVITKSRSFLNNARWSAILRMPVRLFPKDMPTIL